MAGGADDPTATRFAAAVAPLVDAAGGEIVSLDLAGPGDVVLEWEGRPVVAVRLNEEGRDIAWHLAAIEREFEVPLPELDRLGKQRVVKLLDERGAFQLRRSVEQVAEEIGVSRFTVYNYLNRP